MKGRYHPIKRNTPEKTFLSNYKNKNWGANMLVKTTRNSLNHEQTIANVLNSSVILLLSPEFNFVLKDLSRS